MGLLKRIFQKKKTSSKTKAASRRQVQIKDEDRTPPASPERREAERDVISRPETQVERVPIPQHRSHPTAREAAFHGPPRFDWVDIETVAAIKIQSVFRRNQVMTQMEQEGTSTSAIRNRKRRLKAKKGHVASQDAPSFLSCCAVGLAFGDATEEDDEAYRDFQKKQYEERVKQQEIHEDALRKQYLKSHGAGVGRVVEQIEVVN